MTRLVMRKSRPNDRALRRLGAAQLPEHEHLTPPPKIRPWPFPLVAKLEQFEHGGDRKSDQDANLHLDREGAGDQAGKWIRIA